MLWIFVPKDICIIPGETFNSVEALEKQKKIKSFGLSWTMPNASQAKSTGERAVRVLNKFQDMFEEVDLSNAEKHQTIKNILCGTHHGGKGSNFFWFVGQNDKSVYNFKTKIDPDSGNYLLHADKTTLEETEQSVGFSVLNQQKNSTFEFLGLSSMKTLFH